MVQVVDSASQTIPPGTFTQFNNLLYFILIFHIKKLECLLTRKLEYHIWYLFFDYKMTFVNLNNKFKKVILYRKIGLNDDMKDFWFTKTSHTQIWYGEFNKFLYKDKYSPYTTRIFNFKMEFTKQNLSLKNIISAILNLMSFKILMLRCNLSNKFFCFF